LAAGPLVGVDYWRYCAHLSPRKSLFPSPGDNLSGYRHISVTCKNAYSNSL